MIKKEKLAQRQRAASKCKKQLRKKATKWEKRVFAKLKLDFPKTIFQKSFLSENSFFIVDFYIPFPYGVVLEVDGNHHYKGDQLIKDNLRDKYFRDRGFIVLRVRNSEVDHVCFKTLIETAKKRKNESA